VGVNEYTENVAHAMKGLGISRPALGDTTLDDIVDCEIDFDDIELEAFEDHLMKLSSYNVFLKSQRGSFEAKLRILEAEYSRLMGLETHSGPQSSNGGGWLTGVEKESYALSNRADLRSYKEEIVALQAKLAKMKDIPYAVDKHIDLLTIKLRRRIKIEESGRYERS